MQIDDVVIVGVFRWKVESHLAKKREKGGAPGRWRRCNEGRGANLWRWILCVGLLLASCAGWAQTAAEKIIIDTDIGDDVDDAFALALAVRSPELQVSGGDDYVSGIRRRGRRLSIVFWRGGARGDSGAGGEGDGDEESDVAAEVRGEWRFVKSLHGDAVEFLLEQIRKYPGEITLIAIGPLMNVGAAIDKDAATFRKLKRVVLMGGSVRRGYGDLGYTAPVAPMPEWNILNDIPSAQKLFSVGVPLFVMPLDSTQLKMDEVKRAFLFSQGTAVTDQLAVLYHLWGQETPTLFDPMTIVFALRPELCPVTGCIFGWMRRGYARGSGGGERAGLPGFECGGFFSVLFEEGCGELKGRSQKLQVKSQKSEVGSQNSKVKSQKSKSKSKSPLLAQTREKVGHPLTVNHAR